MKLALYAFLSPFLLLWLIFFLIGWVVSWHHNAYVTGYRLHDVRRVQRWLND